MTSTILIVIQHRALRQYLCDWLSLHLPWCHVIAASNEDEAVAQAQGRSLQVIVVDMDLSPLDNGKQVHRIQAVAPGAPVVALGIGEGSVYRQAAARAGAAAYIPKVLWQSELVPSVKAVLAAPSSK